MPAGRYDLIVVGGGAAGLVAARAAAALGVQVALVEREVLGGTSLNTGSVPSKTLLRTARVYAEMQQAARYGARAPAAVAIDALTAMQRLHQVRARLARPDSVRRLTDLGVEVFHGHARFIAGDRLTVDGAELTFDTAMIATGSRPDRPSLPGLDQAGYLTNESVFELTELPRRLLVIGGGPLGCELAQAFCRLGVKTTIAQQLPLFLPREERDAAQILSDAFARDGLEVRLNTRVVGVRVEGGQKQLDLISDDYRSTVTVDQILAGTGRVPNVEELGLETAGVDHDAESGVRVDDFLRTSNPRIFAAGDVCLEHQFTHTAEASARIVVENALCGGRRRWSALTLPWCTFTDPEIAHVGLYVREASARDLPVKTFTVPMHDVDRAVTDAEDVGFVKIHVEERGDRILGATIVGRHAGEIINEITLAMVAGVGLGTLARVIHPYPTQAAAIQQAAEAYLPRVRFHRSARGGGAATSDDGSGRAASVRRRSQAEMTRARRSLSVFGTRRTHLIARNRRSRRAACPCGRTHIAFGVTSATVALEVS
jgi:pyruvate/2-oxoglutarate dehydrogenase complex dihydrolipoamide dehydrogenase (E3) component